MAMDALKNLANHVPGWLKQLDVLNGQIKLRQAELAAVAGTEGKEPETKSLRNKGSTESLRPKDDVPITSAPEATPDDTIPEEAPAVATEPSTPPTEAKEEQITATSALKQAQEAIKAARARARQASAEGAPAAYRTRPMINVYYDSYVQRFFDDLVRFVSSSRNLLRKAKMATKAAPIKRLAEVDMSEGNEDNDNLPLLRYRSTRRGHGPAGTNDQPPDVYDRLDKSLEIVQSMCEYGAHQFLRDGDCNDEISKVKEQLTEALEVATKEMERIQREEPELAKETGELGKARTRRPINMRPEMSDGSLLASTEKDDNPIEVAELQDLLP